jgi:uncharacterized membrane protein YcaP (DUF421 family)
MHAIFHDMFVLSIPLAEKIIRPILVYIALVILLRVFGKRELAQLNPFDLVVLLSLSNTVQNAIIGDDNSVAGGIIGAVTLLLTNYLVVRFLFKHRRLDQMVEGECTVLVKDGEVQQQALAREMMNPSELDTVVRRQGYDGLDSVHEVKLEPGGGFVITAKQPPRSEINHSDLIARLDAITNELRALRESRAS